MIDLNATIEKHALRTQRNERYKESGFPIHRRTTEDGNSRSFAESLIRNEHVPEGSNLHAVMTRVQTFESNVRTVMQSPAMAAQKREKIGQLASELVASVESLKTKRISEIVRKIDARQADFRKKSENPGYGDVLNDLLQLERTKLRLSSVPPEIAVSRIEKIMSEKGYDPHELLVLSSKSEDAAKAADRLRSALPEYVSDPCGVALLLELDELVNLKTGTFAFDVTNGDSAVRTEGYIFDLVSDAETSFDFDQLNLQPIDGSAA